MLLSDEYVVMNEGIEYMRVCNVGSNFFDVDGNDGKVELIEGAGVEDGTRG